jgi:hypothetical protein
MAHDAATRSDPRQSRGVLATLNKFIVARASLPRAVCGGWFSE